MFRRFKITYRNSSPTIIKISTTYRQVFDYDWGLQDDFMGAAQLDLTQFDLGHPQDVTLELKDPARPKQHLGEIFLTATLWPKNQQEKEQVTSLLEIHEFILLQFV